MREPPAIRVRPGTRAARGACRHSQSPLEPAGFPALTLKRSMPTTATPVPQLIRSDGDLADARWLAAPIIDGENIVAARGATRRERTAPSGRAPSPC